MIFGFAQLSWGGTPVEVTLVWNKNPEKDVTGYELSYGTQSGSYSKVLNVGSKNITRVQGLEPGKTYYFVVRAYNRAGLRSRPSAEISHRTASAPVNRPPDTRIVSPQTSGTVVAGQVLRFSAVATDPNGRTGLSIQWSFGKDSGLPDIKRANPGVIRFTKPGTYFVTATATDNQGLADPSPAIRRITVLPAWTAIAHDGWKIQSVSSEETNGYAASLAIDGNPATFWHTRWRTDPVNPPHEFVIDLGKARHIKGFQYLPRQDGFQGGSIFSYRLHVSIDGNNWGEAVAVGELTATTERQTILSKPKTGRFVRLTSLGDANGDFHSSMAEFDVLDGPPANRHPTAASRVVAVSRNSSARIQLRGADPDGNPLTYIIVGQPKHGKLTGAYPNLIYRPNPGFAGIDRITYQVHDGSASSGIATVRIRVTPPSLTPSKARSAPLLKGSDSIVRQATSPASSRSEGTSPSLGSISIQGQKYLTLTVPKSAASPLQQPVIEVSPNLIDWFSGPRHTTVLADNERFLKVRDNAPVTPGCKRHIRVKPTAR